VALSVTSRRRGQAQHSDVTQGSPTRPAGRAVAPGWPTGLGYCNAPALRIGSPAARSSPSASTASSGQEAVLNVMSRVTPSGA